MLRIAAIPALNAEKTIAAVVIGCQKYVDRVVVCDDGSSDMTAVIAERLGAVVRRHDTNQGKGGALRTLFAEARSMGAEAMVTLDADGQHDPKDIPAVLDGLSQADVVVGSRFIHGGEDVPDHRRIINKVLNVMTKGGITDTQSGFRAYGKRAIELVAPAELGMGVDSEILIQADKEGLTIAEVPVSVKYEGKTSVHNPIFHTLDVIASLVKLSSLRHPLLFYGLPGVLVVIVGLYYTVLTALQVTEVGAITPFILAHGMLALTFLMIGLLAFFTGVILFTLTTLFRQQLSKD